MSCKAGQIAAYSLQSPSSRFCRLATVVLVMVVSTGGCIRNPASKFKREDAEMITEPGRVIYGVGDLVSEVVSWPRPDSREGVFTLFCVVIRRFFYDHVVAGRWRWVGIVRYCSQGPPVRK